ncbi:class I SAM-dependent methyltransferase [Prochlorococcus marinus XMU1410]|uniref:methyltransferase domain-containing protein n=1 Tax=Prochlorococcus marinus TaxID=1219 RepID=UPI001AD99AD5|nr:methyltransferase domain-containing protein [Prochlorococcus marinus]MBO8242309.1 class I SAM-dependent methyltransferase [Prochlorococcus marinus XMU1410]MBW3053456.1 SAM-dependent methyltransferase [Prochlorococcus marinus str. MU1410]
MEVLNNYQREKLDESNDEEFYSDPKFVYHLDANFRQNLSDLYEKEIDNYSTVLDLMSSWDSYLPKGKKYKKVIGHGLNKQELERNKIFDSYWIQNFNLSQKIPLGSESVDYCLMVAAWQYLQYPENLTKEIARILSKKGKIIIAFSNRAFWHKAPKIWTSSTEEERVKYVRKVLISNGFNEPKIIKKFTEPALNIFNFLKKDPFYCLIATSE